MTTTRKNVIPRFKYPAAALVMLPLLAGNTHAQEWVPSRAVDFIVPASAGGSLDQTARIVQRIWDSTKQLPVPAVVSNRPGGGHAVAYGFLSQRSSDPHYVALTSPTLLTSYINGRIPFKYTDFTPIALLMTEYISVAVNSSSGVKSAKDLVGTLRKEPNTVVIGLGNALGSTTHLALGLPLQAAGVDIKQIKLVAFNSSNEAVTALLGGHIDVAVASTINVGPQVESGKIRALAISAPRRLQGRLAAVPTWNEVGYEGTFENWRGVIAGKAITPEQASYWEKVFENVARSPEFREAVEKRQLEVRHAGSAAMQTFLGQQLESLQKVIAYLGIGR